MHAVERDEQAVVIALRTAGADIDMASADGTTALELARGWQRQAIQFMLGEHTVGLDSVPIHRTIVRLNPTSYRLEGDPGMFRLWAQVIEGAVGRLGYDEWETRTAIGAEEALGIARRLRNDFEAASGASWHSLDVTAKELGAVRGALLELAYSPARAKSPEISHEELTDLLSDLQCQLGR